MKTRKLETVYTPISQHGFLGAGHIARPVIEGDFSESDPFIMLMDDIFDKKDTFPVGGPHPHAGFETVTLLLEGEIGEEPHIMKANDFEMMTAGSGIVHSEIISKPTKMRLLQLWLNLPKEDRHVSPRVQKLEAAHVPVISANGANIRVYSGTFAGITSPVQNHTPIIIADINMDAQAVTTQTLPSNFTTFIYVIDGSISVGEDGKKILKDEVGWLDRSTDTSESDLSIHAGSEGARFVLYSAEPQHHPIVSHGPFIADSEEEIKQLYADFRRGRMKHIQEVDQTQQLVY